MDKIKIASFMFSSAEIIDIFTSEYREYVSKLDLMTTGFNKSVYLLEFTGSPLMLESDLYRFSVRVDDIIYPEIKSTIGWAYTRWFY